ncbi:MAG: carbohydrate ABC transporter permease [Cellulosilyticaceae bacterium]
MKRKKKQKKQWMTNVVLVIIIILTTFPVVYTLTHSLKGEEVIEEAYKGEYTAIERALIKPFYINIGQYEKVLLRSPEVIILFWNSVKVVVPVVVFQLIIGVSAAYGFAKLKFWGSEVLFFIYIIMMLMPFQVTVVPNYLVLHQFKLLDTAYALILPGVFGTFGVFFLKQYIEGIDDSVLEQARIEGAGEFQILTRVIIPMCKPVIVSTAVLLFVDYWNMVEQPMIFLSNKAKYPLSLYLADISYQIIGIGFACSVMYMILPILTVVYAQSDLTEGMSITNLK